MDDPKLIATLIPFHRRQRPEGPFTLDFNQKRVLPPSRRTEQGPPSLFASHGRPRTLTGSEVSSENRDTGEQMPHIQLSFRKRPKNPANGFAFGTDPEVCDVLLGAGTGWVSDLHFCITFNEAGRLILQDFSTNGTAVGYNKKARDEVRHHFTWILDLEVKGARQGPQEVVVCAPDQSESATEDPNRMEIGFKIELADHGACADQYTQEVKRFLRDKRKALSLLGSPGIQSRMSTPEPSQPLTPKRLPVYINEKRIGKGSYGVVYQAVDVSTGARYACKYFISKEQDRTETIGREIRIMREYPHPRIVEVVGFYQGPRPFLVMPYFPLGSVAKLEKRGTPLTKNEIVGGLLPQVLEALVYLHARGVAHRDISPDNILVECRDPLSIKLADFGLAHDKRELQTLCGHPGYIAPEMWKGRPYTPAVDLWSLGETVRQYLPKNATVLPDSDKLTSLLKGMQQTHVEDRWSIEACVAAVKELASMPREMIDDYGSPATGDAASGSTTLTGPRDRHDRTASKRPLSLSIRLASDVIPESGQSKRRFRGDYLNNTLRRSEISCLPAAEEASRRFATIGGTWEHGSDRVVESIESDQLTSTSGEFPVTYPSGFFDCTNLSGCYP